jgi:hypothetical protein
MEIRKVIQRRIRLQDGGVDFRGDLNAAISANVGRPGPPAEKPDDEGGQMSEYRKLTHEELNEMAGEELPERAAMSLINANVAAPVNLAAALNVASDNSIAYANATQNAPITQSN